MQREDTSESTHVKQVFYVVKHIRTVPPFQEKQIDKYCMHFEKVAENIKWPTIYKVLLLEN